MKLLQTIRNAALRPRKSMQSGITYLLNLSGGVRIEAEIWVGKVARVTGLEPATSGVTGRRSNQLSYTPDVGTSAP